MFILSRDCWGRTAVCFVINTFAWWKPGVSKRVGCILFCHRVHRDSEKKTLSSLWAPLAPSRSDQGRCVAKPTELDALVEAEVSALI